MALLTNLCAQLADLNKALADIQVKDREDDARKIADHIVRLEQQILSLPGEALADATVKLQILKTEMGDCMTPVQEEALGDVIRIVSSESVNEKKPYTRASAQISAS